MKTIMVLIMCMLLGTEATTLLGLHNPDNPVAVQKLGAGAVRIIVKASTIRQSINKPGHWLHHKLLSDLKAYRKKNIRSILTVSKWVNYRKPLPGPASAGRIRLENLIVKFVEEYGMYIDIICLDNEPSTYISWADMRKDDQNRIASLGFYASLAQKIRDICRQNKNLSRLKIASPAIWNIHSLLEGDIKKLGRSYIYDTFSWADGDKNIDYIDLHTHLKNIESFGAVVAFAQKHSSKKIIITEWSQSLLGLEWLSGPLSQDFIKKWDRSSQTGIEYVESCYKNPVDVAEWNDFMSRSPYQFDFLKECYQMADKAGVIILCYGGHKQYGNVKFDTKQLLAQKTVRPLPGKKPIENYHFVDWFRKLSGAAHSK